MKRLSLFTIIIFMFCMAIAQNKDFQDYLSHCKQTEIPFEISMDSTKKYWPEIGKKGTDVSKEYVHKFVCKAGEPCDDNPSIYRYDYGVQAKVGNFIIVYLNKLCYECYTDFGINSAQTLMLVYTFKGELVNAMPILKGSDQHFYNSKIEKCNTSNCILCVHTIQGTVLKEIGQTGVFRSTIDYFDYTIDTQGFISCRKVKTEKVKTTLGPSPLYKPEVIEKGW